MHRHEITANLVSPWSIKDGKISAPVVMITVGVHCGSRDCIYYNAKVLRESVPRWEGVPVCLDHPKLNGKFVDINHSESIRQSYQIGTVSNVRFERNRLCGTVNVSSSHPKRSKIQSLREVSVGVLNHEIEVPGRFGNKRYRARAVRVQPDHLALLSDCEGACSWEDGCGIRANKKGDDRMKEELLLPPEFEDCQHQVTVNIKAWENSELLIPVEILEQIKEVQ